MNATGAVRIGAVPYLNARPLLFGLERWARGRPLHLLLEDPPALADGLADGRLDLALIPSVELARIEGVEIVPGIAIGSDGPAGSVLLFSRMAPPEVRRLALDPHSRTSNVLARLLLAEVWGASPRREPGPEDTEAALAGRDAAVRMGDKALFEPKPAGLHVEDLGTAWRKLTGLPFVYAVWAAREGALDRALYETLHGSKRDGMAALDRIAEEHTFRGRREPALARAYLRSCIRYRLGSPEVRGLQAFLRMAAEHGLVPRVPELRFAAFGRPACHEAAGPVQGIR